MNVQDHIRVLEQRHGTEVFARVPLGENRTWGVNVQFHRVKDGAFLEVQPVRSFDWGPGDWKRLVVENAGTIRGK